MNESFDRILNLAQKSNSRLIIFDRAAGKHLVVMGIDDFENLSTGQVPVQVADEDAQKDHELIQKLNQEIADWRNKAQKQEIDNNLSDVSDQVSTEVTKVQEETLEPVEAISSPSSPTLPSSWHRLGDVIARYQPAPRMPEVRYEPNPTDVGEKTEPLEDDPIFLEEPVE